MHELRELFIFAAFFEHMDAINLLIQMREEDSEPAFRALFDMQYPRLFRIAYYYLQDDNLAKETTLDVLADLWTKRKTMVIPQDFRHYSFVMMRNAAINALKREYSTERISIDSCSEAQETAYEDAENSELFETYERLLEELPDRCREVFCRVKEDEQSYAEVASAMGISVKTVDAQLQKALKHLREGLSKYLGRESGKRFFMLFL